MTDAADTTKRPPLVWIAAALGILTAAVNLYSQVMIVASRFPVSGDLEIYVASWTIVDKAAPLLLNALLGVASLSLVRMRRSAVPQLASYLGGSVLFMGYHALATRWVELYGGLGVATNVIWTAVFGGVLLYALRLRSRGALY